MSAEANNNKMCEKGRIFEIPYKCFSMSKFEIGSRKEADYGGKVIMPPKILESLLELNITYPILFKFTNNKTSKYTHCGVLEFIADDGTIYLPSWMMQTLLLEEGDFISIKCITLPLATFIQLQPQHSDFLDISDQKAVLEKHLTSFHCLTVGDIIEFKYNEKVYKISILKAQPQNAVCINECDMAVDILTPLDKEEPKEQHKEEDDIGGTSGFVAFQGKGHRLQERTSNSTEPEATPSKRPRLRGVPDYDYKIGTLSFSRDPVPKKETTPLEDKKPFQAFSGQGHSLE